METFEIRFPKCCFADLFFHVKNLISFVDAFNFVTLFVKEAGYI
jgi:hypothetical protein